MGSKPKNKCLHCDLPPYSVHLCRRHYKKMLALKNGTYKKDYEKRKLIPGWLEKKRMYDQIYRDKKRRGIDTTRKTDDNALVNTDWKTYAKEWRRRSGDNNIKSIKTQVHYHRNREAIIKHYSNGTMACKHCGCGDLRVLDIDHTENNGAQHRKDMGQLTAVWWIVRNNFPPGFQILCKNCNWIKELEVRAKKFEKKNDILI